MANIAYSKVVIERHRDKLRLEREEREKRQQGPEALFKRNGGNYLVVDDKPMEIGVLTSSFHVFRARMIAKKWGFSHVYGISAQSDPVLFVHLCVRECASIIKDRLMGNM